MGFYFWTWSTGKLYYRGSFDCFYFGKTKTKTVSVSQKRQMEISNCDVDDQRAKIDVYVNEGNNATTESRISSWIFLDDDSPTQLDSIECYFHRNL